MTDYISAFEHIAPFLNQPLVLVGFSLMLVFSIHKQLLKAGIIPKLVYQTRGELDKAIKYHQKALTLHESLGNKEGMATNYGNLGNVFKLQGNKTEAKCYYLMSIELFKQLDSPDAKIVQTSLDELQ